MTATTVQVSNVGRMAYREALLLQKRAARVMLDKLALEERSCISNHLFLVEHDPVYTVGVRQKSYTSHDEDKLRLLGADFVRTDRGGLITFHGPGQLVAYPVLYLGNFCKRNSMKWYIQQLEQTVVNMCKDFRLNAICDTTHRGVWIGDGKIAALGVHGSRYVTTHGIAINCNVDLSWFQHITPCGIPDKDVTSLSKELGRTVSVDQAIPSFLKAFKNQLHCEYVECV